MNSFSSLAAARFSVRHFQSNPVEYEKLHEIMRIGSTAPSACNRQPWRYILLHTQSAMAKLKECGVNTSAPAAIIICGNHHEKWTRLDDGKNHLDLDIAVTTDHMSLAATDLNLGSCWICAFNPEACSKLFAIPTNIEPMVILTIGYPEIIKDPARHLYERLPLESLVIAEF
ncbi:MAG: nitroreductase family protein [Lentisphaeria bacterium]